MAGKYRFLLFDADGTLYDFAASQRVAIAKTWSVFGLPMDSASLEIFHEADRDVWHRYERGEITIEQLQLQRFRLFFDAVGSTADPEEVNPVYVEAVASSSVLFPDSLPVLVELKRRGYSISVCTNGIHEVQVRRLNCPETRGLYDYVFTPHNTGDRKPRKPFFDRVFQEMGIGDDERKMAVLIGDSLGSDILGGINTGINTVWYNPQRQERKPGIDPTYEIANLKELLNLFPPLG
jgi:YjjG family noncanonical pyrimidine nucleotidase